MDTTSRRIFNDIEGAKGYMDEFKDKVFARDRGPWSLNPDTVELSIIDYEHHTGSPAGDKPPTEPPTPSTEIVRQRVAEGFQHLSENSVDGVPMSNDADRKWLRNYFDDLYKDEGYHTLSFDIAYCPEFAWSNRYTVLVHILYPDDTEDYRYFVIRNEFNNRAFWDIREISEQ
jgi:hypothetical protein